jgi:hypothetical protein
MSQPVTPPAPGIAARIAAVRKFITAIVGEGITLASLLYGGSHWLAVVIAVVSAVGVYSVPNGPKQSQ